MIKGQDTILNLVSSKKRDTFPRSVILLGPRGSGKHTITDYISEHLALTSVDITDKLNHEFIDSLYLKPEPYLYVIEMKKISVKEQNMILKFIEEPMKNSFIVLLAETKSQMLNTITNRCQVWNLVPYSKELLRQFTTNEDILSIAKTPGVVKELETINIKELIALCDKLILSLDKASIPNALTITDKLAFKDEKDKYNLDIFGEVLQFRTVSFVKEDPDPRFTTVYKHVNQWINNKLVANVNQRYLFDRFILNLQQELRGDSIR